MTTIHRRENRADEGAPPPPRVEPWLQWSSDTDEVRLVRPQDFVAGEWTEIEVTITLRGSGLEAGERLGFGVPFGFPTPRPDDPWEEAFLTVRGPKGARLVATPMGRLDHLVWLALEEGRIEPGEAITIVYGDRGGGGPGVRVPRQAAGTVLFPCFRDRPRPALLPASPRTSIRPASPVSLRAHLPATAQPGQEVTLSIVLQDAFGNRPDADGEVEILNAQAVRQASRRIRLTHGSGQARVIAPERGAVRMVLRETRLGSEVLSNPMEIRPGSGRDGGVGPEGRPFFGDIHVHTELSYDAGGSIDEMYAYARDVAGLDFAAAADHMTAVEGRSEVFGHDGTIPGSGYDSMEARWQKTCASAASFHRPGSFVTFVGCELAPTEFAGHRNVYWLEDRPAMLDQGGDAEARPLTRLLARDRVLAIPHHMPIRWGAGTVRGGGLVYGDLPQAAQPVVEIYSKHGRSEYLDNERPLRGQCIGHFVQDFLEAGHRFGFIAGSDSHLANPGSPLREGPYATLRYRAGLAAVWAKELTREAIWDALCARRCYATTGPKIVLHFQVGDLVMGQEGNVEGARTVRVQAHGEAPLILVEIIRNGRPVARWDPHRHRYEVDFAWEDSERSDRAVDYYYARVRQHDGEWAWASPIWVSNCQSA